MICIPCRVGGDLNKAGWYAEAHYEHEKCKGCDCQHRTGGKVE